MNRTIIIQEIEIGHLDLKYRHTRIRDLKSVLRLSHSMEHFGQITPVIVVASGNASYILIDGYLRVAALKYCRKDTVLAEVWKEKEHNLLAHVLARTQDRNWDVFEQAALIRELYIGHNLSHSRIAGLLGKDKSFITRRLALIETLDDDIIELIKKGAISTWSASRVLAPMARATPEHAKRLTQNLVKENISTRNLTLFLKHYKKSNKKHRLEMVTHPHLFLKALKTKEEQKKIDALGKDPESKWLKNIQIVGNMLHRLGKEVPVVFYATQSNLDRRLLLTGFEETKAKFISLNNQIRRIYGKDDTPRNQTGHSGTAIKGCEDSKNKPSFESLKEYSPSSCAGQAQRSPGTHFPTHRDRTHHQGAVPVLQR